MLISEKGLVRVLKRAYKRGGYTIVNTGDNVVLYTDSWYLRADWEQFPRKALGVIVEHLGTLPTESAIFVEDKAEPQTVMTDTVAQDMATWCSGEIVTTAHVTSVMVGALRIYQSAGLLSCHGIRDTLLGLVEQDVRAMVEPTIRDTSTAEWVADGERVIVEAVRVGQLGRATEPEKAVWAALESVDLTMKQD